MSPPGELRARLEQGLAHHRAGRAGDAERIYRAVLADDPENADAHHFLGLLAHAAGDDAEAERLITQAIGRDEARATFHLNLGAVRFARRRHREALSSYRRAAELDPALGTAHLQCGNILALLDLRIEAEAAFRSALAIEPESAEALAGLGAMLTRRGLHDEAVTACRRATALNPDIAAGWINLGNALSDLGDFDDAEGALREAILRSPEDPVPHYNLGNLLNKQWRRAEALEEFRRALACDPDHPGANHNLLINLVYGDGETEESLFRAHSAWGRRVEGEAAHAAHTNLRDPERRLRIGYVSPDLRTHSCARFLEPLLGAHDPAAVEIVAYANVQRPDEMTDRLRTLVAQWRDIRAMTATEAADLIRADAIDILVDLAGHTADNRLDVFTHCPAPIQATWLGYPTTTGLAGIDYRLSDALADPPGAADAYHSETLLRLVDGFLCYGPSDSAPEVAEPPCLTAGHVSFGSFNNLAKITPAVVETWSEILHAVPNARLVLKSRHASHPATRARILAAFADHGVAPDRVIPLAWIPRTENPIARYDVIDIALDPFPYNGTTTSFEALWMGVPVIALAGARHSGRVGHSILAHAGLPELIAPSREAYVALARDLALAPERVADYRCTLRARLAASPLTDAPAFARKIEDAYRTMWQRWCIEAAP